MSAAGGDNPALDPDWESPAATTLGKQVIILDEAALTVGRFVDESAAGEVYQLAPQPIAQGPKLLV